MQDNDHMRHQLSRALARYKSLGLEQQVDYAKFHLYSLITHSTAIEGSTLTEVENQLLFDEGITPASRPLTEQLMNLDLRQAYRQAIDLACSGAPLGTQTLCRLSALVMRNTGSLHHAPAGDFDSSQGQLRRLNVTAGAGGRSYVSFLKVESRLREFCQWLNEQLATAASAPDAYSSYLLSFEAHYRLVTIHPWVDGNGRMARLLMNLVQWRLKVPASKVTRHHRAAYITALARAQELADSAPFTTFMMAEHIANLDAETERARGDLADNP